MSAGVLTGFQLGRHRQLRASRNCGFVFMEAPAELACRYFEPSVIGAALLVSAFLPFLEKGPTKKVVTVSGFVRDVDFVVESGHPASASYSAPRSKLCCRIQREGFLIEPPRQTQVSRKHSFTGGDPGDGSNNQ